MSKLITYFSDEGRSTIITDEQYQAIREAINDKDRFIEVNNQMINLSDVKSIESAGAAYPVYRSQNIPQLSAPDPETNRSGNYPPKFWRTIWHINAERLAKHYPMIKNDLIENAFNGTELTDPEAIVEYILQNHTELETQKISPIHRAI